MLARGGDSDHICANIFLDKSFAQIAPLARRWDAVVRFSRRRVFVDTRNIMSKKNTVHEVCRSKLFISGEHLDPKRVTRLLGVEADDEWRKGERSLAVYKEGKRVPSRPTKFVHRRGGWRRAIDKDKEDLDVSAQLAYWCELLKSREAAVRTLQAQGCKMNIDLFIDAGPVVYIRIPPASLRDLGISKLN
jgi:hypothetical protein